MVGSFTGRYATASITKEWKFNNFVIIEFPFLNNSEITVSDNWQQITHPYHVGYLFAFKSEDLISYRSLAQHFDFTEALIKWAHSRLRNYFMSASVGSKGKSK